jgi:hypothetical protein
MRKTARRQAELEQLKEALKQAEAARDAGRDPHDGDTTGNARGGTRSERGLLGAPEDSGGRSEGRAQTSRGRAAGAVRK